MVSTSYNQKRCATCEYWDGARYANERSRSVEYEMREVGRCKNLRSSHKNKDVKGSDGCSYWSKWHEIE